ncbi:MAG: HK97 family phage prohead protease [Isosphaeraceae bacterium]
MSKTDYRFVEFKPELRAIGDGPPGKLPTIVGRAAVANKSTTISAYVRGKLVKFVERFAPGAFKRAIAEGQDVVALYNHDDNYVLGRTSSGTLRMVESPGGDLDVEIDPPDTSYARDLVETVGRGDIRGMSIAFRPAPNGVLWNDQRTDRTLTDVDLGDVSIVTRPAYPQTEVSLRSDSPAIDELAGAEQLRDEARRQAGERAERLRSIESRLA